MTRDEILDQIEQTAARPYGPERSAATALVVTMADEAGDEEMQVYTRLRLSHDYAYGAEEWKSLAPFVWCLARHDERPDLFGDRMGQFLLRRYRNCVEVCARNPAVPLERVTELEAGAERLFRERGASLRAVYATRLNLARILGRDERRHDDLAAWRTAPRDELSDCAVCDPQVEVEEAVDDRDLERAVTLAAPLLTSQEGCTHQPSSIRAASLLALERTGRPQAAWDAYVRSYRVLRHAPGRCVVLVNHLCYLAVTGRVERGLAVVRRHAAWTATCESAWALMWLVAGFARLLREAERCGRGAEELGVDMDESTLWCPGTAISAATPIAQAADQATDWARRLAAQFDARNGNDAVGRSIERTLAEPSVWPARSQAAGGSDGAGDGAAEGSVVPAAPVIELLRTPEELPLADDEPGADATGDGGAPAAAPAADPQPGADQGATWREYPRTTHPEVVAPASFEEALRRGSQPSPDRSLLQAMVDGEWLRSHWQDGPAPDGLEAEYLLARADLRYRERDAPGAFEDVRAARRLLAEALSADLDSARVLTGSGEEAAERGRLLSLDFLAISYALLASEPDEALTAEYQALAERGREHVRTLLETEREGDRATDPAWTWALRCASAIAFDASLARMDIARYAAGLGFSSTDVPDDGQWGCVEDWLDLADRLMEALRRRGGDPDGSHSDYAEVLRAITEAHAGEVYRAARRLDALGRSRDPMPAFTALRVQGELGMICARSGLLEQAVEHLREAVNLMVVVGLKERAASFTAPLGGVLRDLGRPLEAAEVLETGLELSRSSGLRIIARGLRSALVDALTDIREDQGVRETALAVADDLAAQGWAAAAADYTQRAAEAAQRSERPDDASALFTRAADMTPVEQDPPGDGALHLQRRRRLAAAARALVRQPSYHLARARMDEALGLLERARAALEDVPEHAGYSAVWEEAQYDAELVEILLAVSEPERAVEAASRAAQGFLECRDLVSAARELAIVAHVHSLRLDQPGQLEQAREALAQAREVLESSQWDNSDIRQMLNDVEERIAQAEGPVDGAG